MADNQELDATTGAVAEEAGQPATPPTGAEAAGRQPEAQQAQDLSGIDLDNLPQFRKWKSGMDKQMAAIRSEMTAAQQKAFDIEQRWHQAQMAGMDEIQRAQYENQLLRSELQKLNNQRQLDAYAFRKEQDIRHVAAKKGLSYEQLVEALPEGADSFQLWEVADELVAQKGTKPAVRPDQNIANQVDVGGSRPTSAGHKYQQLFDEGKRTFDVNKMLDAMAAAGREGLTIKE